MPSAVYFRRLAESHRLLAKIEPVESEQHRAMALDCMTKARELDLDAFQSQLMPIRDEWRPSGIQKRTKAAPVDGLVARQTERKSAGEMHDQ
jgi:hypothetical protein